MAKSAPTARQALTKAALLAASEKLDDRRIIVARWWPLYLLRWPGGGVIEK